MLVLVRDFHTPLLNTNLALSMKQTKTAGYEVHN